MVKPEMKHVGLAFLSTIQPRDKCMLIVVVDVEREGKSPIKDHSLRPCLLHNCDWNMEQSY